MHGWVPEFPPGGVGLRLGLFDGEGFVYVRVGDDPRVYNLSKSVARRFVRRYGSIDVLECGGCRVCLWVLPLALLELGTTPEVLA